MREAQNMAQYDQPRATKIQLYASIVHEITLADFCLANSDDGTTGKFGVDWRVCFYKIIATILNQHCWLVREGFLQYSAKQYHQLTTINIIQ